MMRLADIPTMEVGRDYISLGLKLDKSDIHSIQATLDKISISNKPKDFSVEIARKRKKRSLDANAYYWVLVGEIAKALGISETEVHNWLLQDYGTPMKNRDGSIKFVLQRDDDEYLRDPIHHLRPTEGTETRKGIPYRWYVEIKGSRHYDTKEMSRLIDGTVEEAKGLGIETMTPDQVEELKQKWGVA